MSDLDAIVDTLEFAGSPRVYIFGRVPSAVTYPYVVVSPAPGAPEVRTLDGHGDPVGRFAVQHFGRSIESVIAAAERTFATFDGEALTRIPGEPVAWQEVASTLYRDPDDGGVLSITHTYRY